MIVTRHRKKEDMKCMLDGMSTSKIDATENDESYGGLINQFSEESKTGDDSIIVVNQRPDITQDEINDMAATAEPDLLDKLSAEEIMPSFQKNPYTKAETEYTEVEMDIVRYIVQDMIDAAKAV